MMDEETRPIVGGALLLGFTMSVVGTGLLLGWGVAFLGGGLALLGLAGIAIASEVREQGRKR